MNILNILLLITIIILFIYGIYINNENKKIKEFNTITKKNYEDGYKSQKNLNNNNNNNNNINKKNNKIFYKGDQNWKYTNDKNDLDCLIKWDYYDSDKSTIIKKEIPRITNLDKESSWCATKFIPLPTNQQLPDNRSTVIKTLDEYKGDIIGIGAVVGTGIVSNKFLSSSAGKLIKTKISSIFKNKLILNLGYKMQAGSILKLSKSLGKNPKILKNLTMTITKNAAKLSKSAGRLTAKFGLSTSTKLLTKLAKLRPDPTIVFEIISMGLDLGDAGGYGKMQTKEMLYKIKSESDKQFKKASFDAFNQMFIENNLEFKEDDFIWPMVYDPLDDTEIDMDELINKKIDEILNNENHELSKPIFEKINLDLQNKVIKPEDLENEKILDKYFNLLDIDKIHQIVFEDQCKSAGGIIYDNNNCTLSEEKCIVWPIPKDKDGNDIVTYREFKDGKCIIADSTVRKTCDDMDIPYDIQTGICNINENYCNTKGAEWRKNEKINNEYDCVIPLEQKVFETIFGETITRGLKQVFDPDQYKGCGFDGEIKIKDKCMDIPNGDLKSGTNPQIWDCNGTLAQKFYYNTTDETIRTIANYEKCFDVNKTDNGTLLQLWDCNGTDPQKFIYDEKTKQLKLKKNEKKCLDLIYDNSTNGTKFQVIDCRGDTDAQKFNMKRNMITDMGITCDIVTSRVADCPPSYTNNGLSCGRGADSKTSDFGLGKFESADCPAGYYNDGSSCMFKLFTTPSDKWYSAPFVSHSTDMKNCENKWGQGNCESVGVSGSKKALYKCSLQAKEKGYDNWEHWGPDDGSPPFCSPYKGWRQFSLSEAGKCPPANDTSGKYTNRTGALCYVKCDKEYGPDYYNNGTSCFRDVSTLDLSHMSCKDDERLIGGRCYPKCPPGYTNTGLTCHKNKQRKVKYSTKKN
jgi:hypothetical protein